MSTFSKLYNELIELMALPITNISVFFTNKKYIK